MAARVSPAPRPGRPVRRARRRAPAETRERRAARSRSGEPAARALPRGRAEPLETVWLDTPAVARRVTPAARVGRRTARLALRAGPARGAREARGRRAAAGTAGGAGFGGRGGAGEAGGTGFGGRGGAGGSGANCSPCPACMRCVNGACSADTHLALEGSLHPRRHRADETRRRSVGPGHGQPDAHRIPSVRSGSAIPRRRRRLNPLQHLRARLERVDHPREPVLGQPAVVAVEPVVDPRAPTTTRPARRRSAPSARRSTRRRFRPDWRPSRRGAARPLEIGLECVSQ